MLANIPPDSLLPWIRELGSLGLLGFLMWKFGGVVITTLKDISVKLDDVAKALALVGDTSRRVEEFLDQNEATLKEVRDALRDKDAPAGKR